MPRIQFDPAEHKYTVDGEVLPSVTEILSSVGIPDFSKVPKETLDAALVFGKCAHIMTELYDRDDLDIDGLDPELRPLLDQWIEAKKILEIPSIADGLHVEEPVCTKEYAGTPDRFWFRNNALFIPDVKTGIDSEVAPFQTFAYAGAIQYCYPNVANRIRRYSVHLIRGAKTCKIVEHKDAMDMIIFRSALNIYNYRKGMMK